jgi:hypothetical protein
MHSCIEKKVRNYKVNISAERCLNSILFELYFKLYRIIKDSDCKTIAKQINNYYCHQKENVCF